ncbi:MAG: helix-turn-helix domain-containing protein, partial [Patescibacteria group bacterium]
MAKFKVRERAISLRKQLKSYSQIKKILGVSKSSLSLWLQNYPLPKWRIRELRDNNEQRIEKFRLTMQAK